MTLSFLSRHLLCFALLAVGGIGSLSVATAQVSTAAVVQSLPAKVASTVEPNNEPDAKEEKPSWNIESPPGPIQKQTIDCNEGTWMSLDVSPDGKQVVFDLLGDLYLMPIEGADGTEATGMRLPQRLTSGIAWDMQPRFSPDGKHIALTSDREGKSKKAGDNIWILRLSDQQLTQISNETYRLLSGPNWSPDGQYIVARKHFSSRRSLGAGEVWAFHRDALAMDAMAGVQLTKRPNDQKDVNEPVYSPDGKYVYYSQDTTPGDTFEYDKDSHQGIYSIKRIDLERGETETLISGPGGACRPTPSHDGKRLAFVRRVGAKTGLHVFDLESGAIRLIDDGLERDMQEAWAIHGVYSAMAWTPDDKAIVAWAGGKIWRIDVADGKRTQIPFRISGTREIRQSVRFPVEVAPDKFDVKMLRDVQVSPSGDRVVYQALGYLYVKELPDGTPKRLTTQTEHFEFQPSFSRDGRYVVYSTWSDSQLGSIRVASADREAAESWIVTDQPGHYGNPVFSPDGKSVVYLKRGGGYLLSPLWSRETGVYVTKVRDGEPIRISRSGSDPQFGNSNDRVFLTRREGGDESDNVKLISVDLSGNDEREHYSSDWATQFCVSPDRKWIAFVERFHVLVAPMIDVGLPIHVGPDAKGLPVVRVSEQAGDFVHFSGDSRSLHWSLGPNLFTAEIAEAMTPKDSGSGDDAEKGKEKTPPREIAIGFQHPHAKPTGVKALVGGRVVTMGKQEVIEDGVILIDGNRIIAVGKRGSVNIPADAKQIDVSGRVILPGFVDTHAHGPMATGGITPQHNWIDYARLAFGVTTIHDPSNDTHSIFAASEMTKAGLITAPRTFSTGKILYGATGSYKAEIDSLEDAEFHLARMKAVGAFSVKSYNQPRRDQRQQVIAAARKLNMMVVPEGGSTFMHNMTMIVDGHTGIEHTLPVQKVYDDVMDLWRSTKVGYTPTLNVAYGGLGGENYWYEIDDLWLHTRLQTFIPPHVLNPRSIRRSKAPREDYNHIKVAGIARQVVENGGSVQAGGHGQLAGLGTHWEMWSFCQGGMSQMQSLRCGTLHGAQYLGLDKDLGSIEVGKLADILIYAEDADPTKKIRDSERIQFVVANGEIYEADRMNRFGSPAPRPPFFWENGSVGIAGSINLDESVGCSCHRGRQCLAN
ncbi:amidohydrolase family protein [Stieleria varia]|uniref:Translocation protein TolB n=1 Tax=Stieleria varia TaxID=2528005 RepID=A0A5C6B2T8_9BACT|nr:amidohydrolase family protein [Stieleria varia]TWU06258.1 translocation protein TolB [Stieleria varia]